MPLPGRIKKVRVRFIGKFLTIQEGASEEVLRRLELEAKEEVENKVDSKREWLNTLYLNGNLFSIILFRDVGLNLPVGSIISTFRCQEITGFDDSFDIFFKSCDFDYDINNYELLEGDVINIRTEIERNIKSS